MATRSSVAAKEKSREEAFRCAICWDTLSSPLVTECSHAFCGPCIKTAFSLKKECPTCRKPANPRALARDLALETELAEMVDIPSAGDTIVNARVSFRSGAESAAPCIEQWTCSRCTCENSIAHDRCAVCSARRPAVARSATASIQPAPPQRYQLVPSQRQPSQARRCEASSGTAPPSKKAKKASDAAAAAPTTTTVAPAKDTDAAGAIQHAPIQHAPRHDLQHAPMHAPDRTLAFEQAFDARAFSGGAISEQRRYAAALFRASDSPAMAAAREQAAA